jgi:hypothetical protein
MAGKKIDRRQMSPPRMEPSFFTAFRDPRFLITLVAICGTACVAHYRLGEVEKNQAAAKIEAREFAAKLALDTKERRAEYDARLNYVERELSVPRYTLDDDEKRMAEFAERNQRELDRRQAWMDDQNRFRLGMVEFAAETRHATAEMRGLIKDLKGAGVKVTTSGDDTR